MQKEKFKKSDNSVAI